MLNFWKLTKITKFNAFVHIWRIILFTCVRCVLWAFRCATKEGKESKNRDHVDDPAERELATAFQDFGKR